MLCATISVLSPESGAGAGSSLIGGAGSVKAKTAPMSDELTSASAPPILATRRREMARPSPVPACGWFSEGSACSNSSKIASRAASGTPGPESRTSKRSRAPSRATRTPTPPRSVNFTALPMRLTSTCRSRAGSPTISRGVSGEMTLASSNPFAIARGASNSTTLSTKGASAKASWRSSNLPASILEKSRMSSISCESERLESPIAST